MQSPQWRHLTRARRGGRYWLALALVARAAGAQPASPSGDAAPTAPAAPAQPAPAPSPDPDPAQAVEEAHAAFQRGKTLLDSRDLRGALREFERAYQLSPAYQVLYYVGAVNVELQQWARARQAFELYLELGGDQLGPQRVAEVRLHLEELNKRTATLTLTLNVPGAEVQVDGTTLTSTRISGLILDTGQHVVRVSKPGFRPLEQVVNANVGENLHLVLPLAPLVPEEGTRGPGSAPPAPSAAGPVARLPAAPEQAGTPWVAWAITGALAIGWATTGALAIKAEHDRDVIERPGTSPERIDSAQQTHRTLAIVSDALLAATLASAGVSAYLTWWAEPASSGTSSASSQVSLAPQGLSAGLRGRF